MGQNKEFNPRHQSKELQLIISWVTMMMVTKLAQIATVFFSDKIPPYSQSPFFLIYYFPPSSSPYTCMSDLLVVGLCYINLLPKLLSSSCESEKPLLRYHFHINAVRVLIVEYLMWRQQLFLELLYRHAPVCLLAVLIFFLGVLWKIVFAGRSLFFYIGSGYLRTELSSAWLLGLP